MNPVSMGSSNYMLDVMLTRMADLQTKALNKLFDVSEQAVVTNVQPLGNLTNTSVYIDTYA